MLLWNKFFSDVIGVLLFDILMCMVNVFGWLVLRVGEEYSVGSMTVDSLRCIVGKRLDKMMGIL